MNRKVKVWLKQGVLFIFVVAGFAYAANYQENRFARTDFKPELFRQRLNLPAPEVLEIATLGYKDIYASWLWLQSIQAFGSGWITHDKTTQPIYRYFDVLTDLDPHFAPAYKFGNLIIADNRFDYDLGQKLLKKGVFLNPNNAEIAYLGLYNAIWAMNDLDQARWFIHFIKQNPNAPNFMKRLEEYIERESGQYEVALNVNIGYYLQYIESGNETEAQLLMESRIPDVLDRWYERELVLAAEKYVEENGEHPWHIADLSQPKYLEPFKAPTMESLARSLDNVAQRSMPIEEKKEQVIEQAYIEITGVPPDPYGTWYYIFERYRESFEEALEEQQQASAKYYITTPRKQISEFINPFSYRAQQIILKYIRSHDGELPPDEAISDVLVRDSLGGHFVYDRDEGEMGIFYSTAARRIGEGKDPRVGAQGLPPYRFQQIPRFSGVRLEPSLHDFPVDERWGREHGYIGPDGETYWKPWAWLPEEEREEKIKEMEGASSDAVLPEEPVSPKEEGGAEAPATAPES